MSLLGGKCLAPKNPTPGVTTEFCVYVKGHEDGHSWEHTPTARAKRLFAESANRMERAHRNVRHALGETAPPEGSA